MAVVSQDRFHCIGRQKNMLYQRDISLILIHVIMVISMVSIKLNILSSLGD